MSCGINAAYVLSTPIENYIENNNAVDKQLIYTPRYTANANITFGYANFYLLLVHQYTGYRFTSTDNSQWLDPYNVTNLKVNVTIPARKCGATLFAGVNNVFNENYQGIRGFPMPLRNYDVGITIQINHKLKSQ